MRALNRPLVGFFIGLLMPLLGYVVVWLALRSPGQGIGSFTETSFSGPRTAALVISLSCLANALPFAYFNSKRMEYAARGVFIITMLFAVLFVWLKFVV